MNEKGSEGRWGVTDSTSQPRLSNSAALDEAQGSPTRGSATDGPGNPTNGRIQRAAQPSAAPASHRAPKGWRIVQDDCAHAMAAMPEDSVDAVVCDPPYGLGFMGKDWDSPGGTGDFPMRRTSAANTVNTGASRQGGRQRASEDWHRRQVRDARSYQEWTEGWGREALRVLKPGGYILAFGGTRTYHRLAAGLEDAGFEVRDMIAWLYGSGFPKHASCLKPAQEPVMLGRKAAPKSAPLQIDACRIGTGEGGERSGEASADRRYTENGSTNFAPTPGQRGGDAAGRWPANVAFDSEAAVTLDEQTQHLHAAANRPESLGSEPTGSGMWGIGFNGPTHVYDDQGGASRFFYVAKPESAERNIGLHGRNPHPTVKPVTLMRWLIRLVTPPGGTVLDPFTGSGTTGIAALREGFDFIGIERDQDYVDVARARILGDAPLLNSASEVAA